mgnify:CR=1 FL=1
MQSYVKARVRIANPMSEHMLILDKVVARRLFGFNLYCETTKNVSMDLAIQIGSVSRIKENDEKLVMYRM